MLTCFKLKLQLSVILVLVLKGQEQILDAVLASQDSHDFIIASVEIKGSFNNCNLTICSDSYMNLYHHPATFGPAHLAIFNHIKRIRLKIGGRIGIRNQLEVDFVVNQGSLRYYIQSAFALPSEEKVKQESASLLKIGDSFKKIIIVKDDIMPKRDDNGIVTIGMIDFLLQANSLDL